MNRVLSSFLMDVFPTTAYRCRDQKCRQNFFVFLNPPPASPVATNIEHRRRSDSFQKLMLVLSGSAINKIFVVNRVGPNGFSFGQKLMLVLSGSAINKIFVVNRVGPNGFSFGEKK
ncbi:MAG: hypothetical protein IPN29_07215 [Saprospiraceae bacterium]|nr:hypothetical protein [Saprospiraceae bacterium]